MTSVLLATACQQSLVVVGRGARFILPQQCGIAVRIIAPLPQRIARVQLEQNLSRTAAAHYIAQTDRDRQSFVEQFFRQDVTDPHRFDWVLNLEHLSIEEAADGLVQLCRQRFSSLVPA
jgi:cytidylate kinase